MKNIFKKSVHFTDEYCCSIVKIGVCEAIPKYDRIQKTIVNGENVIISKDIKEGDVMFYISHECEINPKFLSVNNLYSTSYYNLNSNQQEVKELKDKVTSLKKEGNETEVKELELLIKSKCGFFENQNRVKSLKLGGIFSKGFLFTVESMKKFLPDVDFNGFENYLGTDFDMIDGDIFVKPYYPFKVNQNMSNKEKTKCKIENKYKIVKDAFKLHYSTMMLAKNIKKFSPDDEITITKKYHGISFIVGNVKVSKEKSFYRLKNFINTISYKILEKTLFETRYVEYDKVISSASVIKTIGNKNLNKGGYYNEDIYSYVGNMIYPYLPEGVTVYGEIVGFLQNGSCIQSQYDYGCLPKRCKFLIYRISKQTEDGSYEYTINEVLDFTKNLFDKPELKDYIIFNNILYQGKFCDLYKDIKIDDKWHKNVLSRMKNDFGLEQNDKECRNKVPFEGIVLRTNKSLVPEAYKLKSEKFLKREGELMDKGESDIELLTKK